MYRIDAKSPKVQLFRGILICTPLWVCSSPLGSVSANDGDCIAFCLMLALPRQTDRLRPTRNRLPYADKRDVW